jgi:hypothetical protein
MAIKSINIAHFNSLQNLPKLGFFVLKMYHLATLGMLERMTSFTSSLCSMNTQTLFCLAAQIRTVLPDVTFHTKKSQFGYILEGFGRENVGIFSSSDNSVFFDHLVGIFVAIRYILPVCGTKTNLATLDQEPILRSRVTT